MTKPDRDDEDLIINVNNEQQQRVSSLYSIGYGIQNSDETTVSKKRQTDRARATRKASPHLTVQPSLPLL